MEVSRKNGVVVSSNCSSSMAIVAEKRPAHRPGGCVGILFQLFDWNRKFAKKKLFPKKLLPPVRSMGRSSKKFGCDEKMPMAKFLLIADENRGGFPNTRKPSENGAQCTRSSRNVVPSSRMCAPSLVARLMGLESMPALPQEKPRKAVDSAYDFDGLEGSSSSRHDVDLDLGMAPRGKVETRPQKLQKTGFSERQPVSTRFSGDTLPSNRSLLPRTRKQHHKLVSPVKSPRFRTRKSSARLMEVAARILEPGLQHSRRTKCALTYVDSLQANIDQIEIASVQESTEHFSIHRSRQERCDVLGDVVNSKSSMRDPVFLELDYPISGVSSSKSSQDSLNLSHPKTTSCSSDVCLLPVGAQTKSNSQTGDQDLSERKRPSRNDKYQRKLTEEAGSSSLRLSNIRHKQAPHVRDMIAELPKTCRRQQNRRDLDSFNAAKDFISLNKNLNSHASAKTTVTAPTSSAGIYRRAGIGHKGKPNNEHRMLKNSKSAVPKQRITRKERIPTKGTELGNVCSTNRNSLKNNTIKYPEGNPDAANKNSGTASFTFKAPSKHVPSTHPSVEHRKEQGQDIHINSSQPESSAKDSKVENSSSPKIAALRGDELSALLEQKIRELNCLDRGVAGGDGAYVKRSTASILEELISALTKGRPLTQDKEVECESKFNQIDQDVCASPEPTSSLGPQWHELNELQEGVKSGTAAVLSVGSDCDQPSPVSILEASFSTDSCLSDSVTTKTGSKSHFGFVKSSWIKSQSFEPDADLSDSATSTTRGAENNQFLASLDAISFMYNSRLLDSGHSEEKPTCVGEIISNMELLFGGISSNKSEVNIGSFIGSIILDALETLTDTFNTNASCISCLPDLKNWPEFRSFLFDYVIEYLDLRYSYYWKSGYKSLEKLSLFPNSDKLSTEIYTDMLSIGVLTGKIIDNVIEKDMNHVVGKWTDFEVDAFEAGTEIESSVLQALVDETVLDLLTC